MMISFNNSTIVFLFYSDSVRLFCIHENVYAKAWDRFLYKCYINIRVRLCLTASKPICGLVEIINNIKTLICNKANH